MRSVSFCLFTVFALASPSIAAVTACAPVPWQSADDKAEYARRFRALDRNDAEGFAQLGLWCRDRKLTTYANLCFKKALKADPQNATVNKALGNELYEGKWVTPAEAEAARAAILEAARKKEAAARAKVESKKGTPLIPRDEEGHRERVAKSFTAGEKDARQLLEAFVDVGGFEAGDWKAARSPHVRIVVSGPADEAKRLCEIGEFAYRKLSWVTFGRVESRRFAPWGGVMEFVLADDPELEASVELVQKRWPALVGHNDFANMPREVRKNSLEFVDFLDPPVHLHWNPENRASTVANSVGRAIVASGLVAKFVEPRLSKGDRPNSMMNWLLEGAGVWSSVEAVGINDLYRIDGARYSGEDILKKGMAIPWCDLAYEIATTGSSEGRTARTFPQLCRSKLRVWSRADLVMSFGLFDWLVRERQQDYRRLVAVLANQSFLQGFLEVFGNDAEKKLARAAVAARNDNKLMEAFDLAGDRFDRAWRDWAKSAYAVGGSAHRNFEDAPFRIADDGDAPPPAKKD